MKHKISYIFHCKNIKTPLIWALFDEIKYDYGYFIHFLRYPKDFDYYVGFSSKDYNYKNLPNTLWNEVIINIRYILDKHNYQAYGDDYDKYIEMTDSNTLHRLYNI